MRKLLRSEAVAVPAVIVTLTELKSTVPEGVSRKPNSGALAVPAATLPATGVPVLSMVTPTVMVC